MLKKNKKYQPSGCGEIRGLMAVSISYSNFAHQKINCAKFELVTKISHTNNRKQLCIGRFWTSYVAFMDIICSILYSKSLELEELLKWTDSERWTRNLFSIRQLFGIVSNYTKQLFFRIIQIK